jgi:hypothetical protein
MLGDLMPGHSTTVDFWLRNRLFGNVPVRVGFRDGTGERSVKLSVPVEEAQS